MKRALPSLSEILRFVTCPSQGTVDARDSIYHSYSKGSVFYRILCSPGLHTKRIYSGIGFRTWNPLVLIPDFTTERRSLSFDQAKCLQGQIYGFPMLFASKQEILRN
ncbi:hypothetical protein AVEN_58845-1 [Araneus ventricosus]|uniref:Uncharacterized protein n=1 Tax=Araneus ventricosus TaxID=182803 RepID=A0A4Y2K579_ARAVE|nr:hypothetical protein AVEN_58845-1 [Araneus ventricosus]